ncbi:MAG: NADPH:quinone oxidoreductase [Deltaproteobacteria bacterium]|nr:NADPH:quinone oxidoreductase [Deltaproteobacteria bacterium]
MQAIVCESEAEGNPLRLEDVDPPELKPGSLRIQVTATALNRADLMQRRGFYPPPPGASPLLGLECSGVVSEVAPEVTGWAKGDRVMALLAGGGYAEQVVVDAGSCLRVPEGVDLTEAAALPEVVLTVFLNVFQLAGLSEGDWLLVHGGGSGIGTAAIQMAQAAGARVAVTAGSDEKCERCRALGADVAINYREQDFAAELAKVTQGHGVAVILDSIGGAYLEKNLASLEVGGRLVLIGLMGGAKAEISLGQLLMRRLQVIGSTLRTRTPAEKSALVRGFEQKFGSALQTGAIRPIVDRILPLEEAEEAHRVMQASEHFGKLLLQVG